MTLPFSGAVSNFLENDAPAEIRDAILGASKNKIVAVTYPYNKRLSRVKYEEQMYALQIELAKFQSWVQETGQRIAIVFEGRDAAGKGGVIKQVSANLNPRVASIIALATPTAKEQGEWYFQRYVRHLPTSGKLSLFDRSWYNRAVVEKVFGFCTTEQREKFFAQVPLFEKILADEGIYLIKLWLNVDRAEQLRRFTERERDPLKQWKLSSVDVEGLYKWTEYSKAIRETFHRTHNALNPWTIVRSDDKRRARLQAIRFILSKFDYPHKSMKALEDVDLKICGGPEIWNG